MKICIDPGHGGKDPGAAVEGVKEKDINLDISKKIQNMLLKRGHDVFMTRSDDRYVPLFHRTLEANDNEADIFVSIHCNSASNEKASGTETLCYPGSMKGKELAQSIQEQLPLKNRGVKERKNLVVLKYTAMPAVLVECGFLSNPGDRELLKKESFRTELAEAICRGIQKYMEVS